ncbi:MAG TPA: amidophosphoribosyltransferase [Bacteroidota bacterium]|jgi:amidophosphoribosyltransferase|nr:amidophosphoribosyltransferase [Bacteroidota bacterium]
MTLTELDFEGMFANDKPHDHCAVAGVYHHPNAAQIAYYMLHALQHRGQEGSGIVTSDIEAGKRRFHLHKDFGLVNDVFRDDTILTNVLKGSSAIGHNRYSTAGSAANKSNVQPLVVNYKNGNVALAHNGNLTNFREVRTRLQDEGTIFQTTSDSEIVLHLIARSKEQVQIRQILDALNQVRGAFSIAILTDDKLIAARDPHGWRPLAVGKLGDTFVVASETCAFDIIGAKYLCDVEPGEVLVFDKDSLTSGEAKSYHLQKPNAQPHFCIFEYIYFSRPDSTVFGESVDKVRRKFGKALANEHPVSKNGSDEKLIVINVPDSSNTATIGFVTESNKLGVDSKYEIGLIRSHYVGRTFIQPDQDVREVKVKAKFNTVKGVLQGRRVVIVDDSIVRGTTSKQLVKLVRDAGAKEIHFRVTSPPIKFPCHYGIDFPNPQELIANWAGGDVEKIRAELGVDSLQYLSLEKLLESVPHENGESYCTACFSGQYPTSITAGGVKDEYEM